MRGEDIRVLLDEGEPFRIWPYAARGILLVSVSAGRPHSRKRCELLRSPDGIGWTTIGEFHSLDPRHSTTGQPFITAQGTVLLSVWDVDYYTLGRTYFCIFRREHGSPKFEKVYEDENGTYANHFFEALRRPALYIGVGVRGGGSHGRIHFTPDSGYVLRSLDDGKTFAKVAEYRKPGALYQGLETPEGRVLFTTREQASLLQLDPLEELPMGGSTRSAAFIPELGQYWVSGDSGAFFSEDASTWTRTSFPYRGYALRYPTAIDGRVLFTAVGWRSMLVTYRTTGGWRLARDLSPWTRSSFARLALFGDTLYCGSEFDGKLIALPAGPAACSGRRMGRLSGLFDRCARRLGELRRQPSRLGLEKRPGP